MDESSVRKMVAASKDTTHKIQRKPCFLRYISRCHNFSVCFYARYLSFRALQITGKYTSRHFFLKWIEDSVLNRNNMQTAVKNMTKQHML